ncbi:uncharacterized protein BX663DRAFT_494115 [Cokeromyces recurvatus]|uniref:uncharacterized protein n=1 Tax=Cokeromyces recurvatus TaxID=90255 RepID=UPI00221E752D|nr:uncharacterized protein BX663DRAFT_494115 [Cokeromyces recurvatus]KAI7906893.1 hypothetical protein BX663DRAFT_494115 [Cokeromyces recurvatus]
MVPLILIYLFTIVKAQSPITFTDSSNTTSTTTTTIPTTNTTITTTTSLPITTTITTTTTTAAAASATITTTPPIITTNVTAITILPIDTTTTPSITTTIPTTIITRPIALPTVQSTDWDSSGNQQSKNQQSWLKEHNRFIFIIIIGLAILALLIWYIIRSIKGMRKRLEEENQAQLYMIQQVSSSPQPATMSPYPNFVSGFTPQSPPPAYKTQENTPVIIPSTATEHRN